MTHAGLTASSKMARLPVAALAAMLLASTALTAPGLAHAQQAAAQQSGVVTRIIVKGNERIEEGTVLSYLPIQRGQTVTAEQVSQAIAALYQSALFNFVDISLAANGDLTVQVSENPIINRVIFEGEKALKEDKLRDEVSVRPRGVFTPARAQQDVQRIIELYRRNGRISATVTPKIVELPQKRVDLIFEIDEGPKSGVLDVGFIGNKEYSDSDLRDVVVTEKSQFWKFFSTNDNYDPDRIEYDEQKLRDHYRNHGFYDFRVLSSVAELKPDRNAFLINFTVDEGRQYRLGKLTVKTELKRLDSAVLQRLLPLESGDIYSDEKVTAAKDALTYAAGAVGFAFVEIRESYTPNPETGVIDIEFNVIEGPRVYVERVDILGNTQTLDRVIRREIPLAEGDAFNRGLVEQATNSLKRLDFFEDVKIDDEPGSAPDKTNLRVTVREKSTGQLAFSAGYSSVDQLVIDASVEQRNFRGRGQSIRAIASVGSIRQRLEFSFTEPHWRGRNLVAGVDVYSYRYDYTQQGVGGAGYTSTTTGLNLRTGFPLSNAATLSLRYNLRSDNITLPSLTCVGTTVSATCQQLGTKITSLVGYSWSYDKRNSPVNTTRGYTLGFSQDFAGLGGDIKYVKTEANGSWYHGFNRNLTFSAVANVGYIESFGASTVRINERFFKGGPTFRGFEIAGIGPRDTSTLSSLGGKLYAIGTFELTLPTFLPEQYGVKASLFSDFGTLGILDQADKYSCTTATPPTCGVNTAIKDNLALRASAGISIGWKSPLGPIQFDFSRILAKEYYDRTETFRFSTSRSF